jgi:PD-(D/E)XK nuclease superfamily
MAWAINNTLDVCKGAIGPGAEYAETYLEAVWSAAKRASGDIKRDAAECGQQRHAAIERSLRATDPSPEGGQDAVGVWLQAIGFRAIAVERRIYSRRFRYSGTCDCIGTVEDGSLVLIDWKTGKSIYPEYRLQTAAYCGAYEEEFPDKKIAGRYLVRISEDGSIEPHFYPRSTLRLDLAAFLGAKRLFDRVQQLEKDMRKLLKTTQ